MIKEIKDRFTWHVLSHNWILIITQIDHKSLNFFIIVLSEAVLKEVELCEKYHMITFISSIKDPQTLNWNQFLKSFEEFKDKEIARKQKWESFSFYLLSLPAPQLFKRLRIVQNAFFQMQKALQAYRKSFWLLQRTQAYHCFL